MEEEADEDQQVPISNKKEPGLAAKTYANALFELLLKHDDIKGQIERYRQVLARTEQDTQLTALLLDQKADKKNQRKLFRKKFLGLDDELAGFYDLLINNGRWDLALAIYEVLVDRYQEYEGIQVVRIKTDHKLTAGEIEELEDDCTVMLKQRVEIFDEYDPQLKTAVYYGDSKVIGVLEKLLKVKKGDDDG